MGRITPPLLVLCALNVADASDVTWAYFSSSDFPCGKPN